MEQISDTKHFIKMTDMSGKEIIKFAKNVPNCPIGMMVSNHIVWRCRIIIWTLGFTRKLLSAIISTMEST